METQTQPKVQNNTSKKGRFSVYAEQEDLDWFFQYAETDYNGNKSQATVALFDAMHKLYNAIKETEGFDVLDFKNQLSIITNEIAQRNEKDIRNGQDFGGIGIPPGRSGTIEESTV